MQVGKNKEAQAGNVVAPAAEHQQKVGTKGKKVEMEDVARLVVEENESKGKLPRYPGLERWQLIEKMGDGAFSNVYKARDLEGRAGEVAIKVVRKFQMNSSQVSIWQGQHFLWRSCLAQLSEPLPTRGRDVGPCTCSSGLQEAAKGSGGAHKYFSLSRVVYFKKFYWVALL
jgi:hypothetical protein